MPEENNNNNDNNNDNSNDFQAQLQEMTNKYNEQISTNEKLSRTRDGLLSDLQDKKSKLNEFTSKAQNEQEQEALKKGDIDFIVNQRLSGVKTEYEEALNNIKTEKDNLFNEVNQYKSTIEKNTAKDFLMKEIQNTDIQKTAIEDVIDYALRNGDVKEGKLIFKNSDGTPKTVNSRGEQYSSKDFFNELRNQKPHFFENKNGTNTNGNNGSNSAKEMTQAEYTNAILSVSDSEAQKLAQEVQKGNIVLI
jgi:hypothetical protein